MEKNIEKNWELFEKLPEELQEIIFSENLADIIWDICEKNNIEEVNKVANLVGHILLGALPMGNFEQELMAELNLTQIAAAKVKEDADYAIFEPTKALLAEKKEVEPKQAPSLKEKVNLEIDWEKGEKMTAPVAKEKKKREKKEKKQDPYKEGIE